jgi:hypothetical protein
MASPVAASCAGLLKSFNPSWDNNKIETMLLATANPVIYDANPESYLENRLGRGKVDMLKAISTPLFPKLEIVAEDISIINDNNEEINIGETIEYSVIIFNDPDWGEAINTQLSLSTEAQGINFLNNNINIGSIPPGEVGINEASPIIIEFTPDTQIGNIELLAKIISNQDGYIRYEVELPFNLEVNDISVFIGDVTADNIIDILDVVTIVNIVLENLDPTNYQSIAADTNEDGTINIQDIIMIINIIMS